MHWHTIQFRFTRFELRPAREQTILNVGVEVKASDDRVGIYVEIRTDVQLFTNMVMAVKLYRFVYKNNVQRKGISSVENNLFVGR